MNTPATRAPLKHRLKTWPEYFTAVRKNDKPFEIRWDDRDYQVGDILELAEYEPTRGFTGEEEHRLVTYALRGADAERFGLAPGYVAMGVQPLANTATIEPSQALTIEDLMAWHEAAATNAFRRAESYRQAPFARLHVCGVSAEREAGFHAKAALLVRDASGGSA